MADFNRILVPNGSTWPSFPSGLESWGFSGKGQFRTTTQVGRIWEEEYPPLRAGASTTRAFLAYINSLWREKTIFEIMHPHLETPINKTITGTMKVNGGSQTGSTLNVTITSLSHKLLAGDIIKIANINTIYDLTADMSTTGTGNTSLSISPPIFSGGSPADLDPITFTGVKFRAVLSEQLKLPSANYDEYYTGLTLKFRECP